MHGPFTAGLAPARKKHDDAEFDITAMIDLVFLMNIYFMFLFITNSMSELPDLPEAVYASPLDMEEAMIVTVFAGPDPNFVKVEVEDQKGQLISDPTLQEQRIGEAADAAVLAGKKKVLFKAQATVRLREMQRLVGAAQREEMTLHVAVMETQEKP